LPALDHDRFHCLTDQLAIGFVAALKSARQNGDITIEHNDAGLLGSSVVHISSAFALLAPGLDKHLKNQFDVLR
jgi:hypothetical protein